MDGLLFFGLILKLRTSGCARCFLFSNKCGLTPLPKEGWSRNLNSKKHCFPSVFALQFLNHTAPALNFFFLILHRRWTWDLEKWYGVTVTSQPHARGWCRRACEGDTCPQVWLKHFFLSVRLPPRCGPPTSDLSISGPAQRSDVQWSWWSSGHLDSKI